MKIIENIGAPSKEMEELFHERTRYHQSLVRHNLLIMEGYLNLRKEQLVSMADHHDISKYANPERIGYIWMNWMFYCKKNNIYFHETKAIKDIVRHSHLHHIKHNSHHPESHLATEDMTSLNLVEMVCDWTAMSQELGINQGSCIEWARENIDKKWNFSNNKKELIFAIIKELDKRSS